MDKIFAPIKERVYKYLDIKHIKKEVFFATTGISPSNFKGKGAESELGGEKIVNILTSYKDINPDWLITGEGSMTRIDSSISTISKKGIPLIPAKAMAGISSGEVSVLELECERYDIPEFNKKADYLIRVSGNSMSPKYYNGDIVACKKIPTETFIQWGKVYVMDTVQGPLCKRLNPSDKGDDYLLVESDNQKYKPFHLPKYEVRALGIVIGVIRLE